MRAARWGAVAVAAVYLALLLAHPLPLLVEPLTAMLALAPPEAFPSGANPWLLDGAGAPLPLAELPPGQALVVLLGTGGVAALAAANVALLLGLLGVVFAAVRSAFPPLSAFIAVALLATVLSLAGPFPPPTVALVVAFLALLMVGMAAAGRTAPLPLLAGVVAALSLAGAGAAVVVSLAVRETEARLATLAGAAAGAAVGIVTWLAAEGAVPLRAALLSAPASVPAALPLLPPYTMVVGQVLALGVVGAAVLLGGRTAWTLALLAASGYGGAATSSVLAQGGAALLSQVAVAALLGAGLGAAVDRAPRLQRVWPDTAPRRAAVIVAVVALLPGLVLPVAYGALNPRADAGDIQELAVARQDAAAWLARSAPRPGGVLGAPVGLLAPSLQTGTEPPDAIQARLAAARSYGQAMADLRAGGVAVLWIERAPLLPRIILDALPVSPDLPVVYRNAHVELREVLEPTAELAPFWIVARPGGDPSLVAEEGAFRVEPAWRWRRVGAETQLNRLSPGYLVVEPPFPGAHAVGLLLHGNHTAALTVGVRTGEGPTYTRLGTENASAAWSVASFRTPPSAMPVQSGAGAWFEFVMDSGERYRLRTAVVLFGADRAIEPAAGVVARHLLGGASAD